MSTPPLPRRRRSGPHHPDLEPEGGRAVPIADAVDQLLSVRGLEAARSLAAVTALWDAIVGPEVARHVVPSAFRGNELIVDVDAPAWSTEVQFQEATILSRCEEHLGTAAPASLRVRVRPPGTLSPQGGAGGGRRAGTGDPGTAQTRGRHGSPHGGEMTPEEPWNR